MIPARDPYDPLLLDLLHSIGEQDYPKAQLEVLIITEGNSEEAKAIGLQRAGGDIIGLLCCDNALLEPDFLTTLVQAASRVDVVGAYTARYAYVRDDLPLNRYFALLGANDPVCWWLGKADRKGHGHPVERTRIARFPLGTPLPSLGDNGCFFKAAAIRAANPQPATFGSPMCFCEDLRRLGLDTYAVVGTHATWHRTGDTLGRYLWRRWHYVRTLYFQRRSLRRWHLVDGPRDWLFTLGFVLASVTLVPQVLVACYGAYRSRDWCWIWHPVCCMAITCMYIALTLEARLLAWWSAPRAAQNWRTV